MLLLGPPGVSKTTMLRALAGAAASDRDAVHWVTGDEQLSAHVLVGTFDPSVVLREGYRPEHLSPGPLVRAMRDGGILYIEELNRAPSGALNVLITALSESYADVAHLGTGAARPPDSWWWVRRTRSTTSGPGGSPGALLDPASSSSRLTTSRGARKSRW